MTVLDLEGRMQWGNDEFMDLIQEKSAARRSISNIFPEITEESLPQKEKDEVFHVVLHGRNYKVLLRKVICT